ncbi:MAG: LysM peptidoglycan-binding domain-containing protein, partial [Anaerolineales bacterium]
MKKSLVLSITILLILLVPLSVSAQSDGPVYIVEAGDTMSGIARTFGTSVDALMQANGLTNANQLQPGQELVVPGFEGVQGVLATHPV